MITNNSAPAQGAISESAPPAPYAQVDTPNQAASQQPVGGVEDPVTAMVQIGTCMRIAPSLAPRAPPPTVICRMGASPMGAPM